jgi:hypothetical protein
MSRPSPRSRRRGRSRPRQSKILPSEQVREILCGDFAEALKRKVFLFAITGVRGPRRCLLCGADGAVSRVYIGAPALKIDQPDFSAIKAYWLCAEHSQLPSEDPQIVAALTKKGGTP